MANTSTHARALPSDPDATLRPTSCGPIEPSVSALPFLAPPQQPDEIGRLGPYRVLKVLGQGSMGLVLRADDPHLGRPVALKVMLPELAVRPDMRARFLGEARAVAALQHDNIVSIYHVGEDQGVPYFVMPLLKGVSLEEYLRRDRAVTVGQVLRVARDVARGLAAAHERGLIHRDIKPGNLWVDATAGGRIKILDFGLARPERASNHLTHAGMIVGTPAYMPPEQVSGRPEARSDLYSLGAVLYRILAGRLPFPDLDSLELLVAVATQEPPDLLSLAPDVPPDLAALVMRLLAKDPDQRPASALALLEELKALTKGGAAPAEASLAAMVPEEEATRQLRRPGAIRRRAPAAVDPSKDAATEEIPAPHKSRRAKRRRSGGEWKLAVLLGGVTLMLVALSVALVRLLPRPEAKQEGDQQDKSAKVAPGGRPEGFTALFDGKSLDGWESMGKKGPRQWEARDGMLVCRGLDKGMLRTAREYRNFELDLEWRLPSGGRSGVIVRHASPFPPVGARDGIEVRIDTQPAAKPDVSSCGAILGLLAPKEVPLSSPGAWNHYRIRCDGDRVTVMFNQKVVIDTSSQGRIQNLSGKGNIALHAFPGSAAEFRNVWIKELP